MSAPASTLTVARAGPGCTIQDRGRFGHLRRGVTTAGPMDPAAFALANAALGKDPSAAAVEISLGGLTLAVEGQPVAAAFAGGRFRARLGDAALPSAARFLLKPGRPLSLSAGEGGCWTYLAFGGDLNLPPVLGSVATHARSAIGGLNGRALRDGDRIAVRPSADAAIVDTPEELFHELLRSDAAPIRVVLGPQADHFESEEIAAFTAEEWDVSPRSDRMALLLAGRPLRHGPRGFNIVSDGVALGSVQVPGDGRPVVLMADGQPTGGYPKIGVVIRADIGRLAQTRPGERVRFAAVTVEEAVAAWARMVAALGRPALARPVVRTDLASEFLLGVNLIDGVTAG